MNAEYEELVKEQTLLRRLRGQAIDAGDDELAVLIDVGLAEVNAALDGFVPFNDSKTGYDEWPDPIDAEEETR